MAIFKQRINEHSSINPSGFTGYIIKNSNVIIDKSFIKKGTTFINAFDNSNVLIKDCGSPVPYVESELTQYLKLEKKITSENEKRLLPFWVHYHLNVDQDPNARNDAFQGSNQIGLEYVEAEYFSNDPLKSINQYRNDLINNAISGTNEYYTDLSSLIESRIVKDNISESKDIKYTTSGNFYLDNVSSSIRAVFPLNNKYKFSMDNPKIILNLKNREFISIKKLRGKNSAEKDPIYVRNVYKIDNEGYKIIDGTGVLDNTDNYIDSLPNISYVHKLMAESSLSNPLYDQNNTYQELNSYNQDQLYFKIESCTLSGISRNFIIGPYTRDTIAYFKYDILGNKTLQNANNPLSFYFKYGNNVYSLYDFINTSANDLSENEKTKYVYENFYLLKNNENRLKGSDGSQTKIFLLDKKTESSYNYNPDNKIETYTMAGFKKKTNDSTINMEVGKFYTNDGTDRTSSYLSSYLKNYVKKNKDINLASTSPYDFIYNTYGNIHTNLTGMFCDASSIGSTAESIFLNEIKYQVRLTGYVEYYGSANKELNGTTISSIYKTEIVPLFTTGKTYKEEFTNPNPVIDENNNSIIVMYDGYDRTYDTYVELVTTETASANRLISRSYLSGKFPFDASFKYGDENNDTFAKFTERVNNYLTDENISGEISSHIKSYYNTIINSINTNYPDVPEGNKNNISIPSNTKYIDYSHRTDLSSYYAYYNDSTVLLSTRLNGNIKYFVNLSNFNSLKRYLTSKYYKKRTTYDHPSTFEEVYSYFNGIKKSTSSSSPYWTTSNEKYLHYALRFSNEQSESTKISGFNFIKDNFKESDGLPNQAFFDFSKISNMSFPSDKIIQFGSGFNTSLSSNQKIIDEITSGITDKIRYDYDDGSSTTDELRDFLSSTLGGYRTVRGSAGQNLLVIPGVYLSDYNVKSPNVKLTVTANGEYLFDTNSYEDFLCLYFDKNCTKPIHIESKNSYGYYIYEIGSNGKKIYVDPSETGKGKIVNNKYVSFNYKKLREFSYKTTNSYKLEIPKDWYNVNTYIDYSKIITDNSNIYQITSKLSGFTDEYYVDDEFNKYGDRKHVGINSESSGLLISNRNIGTNNNYLKVASLFTTNDSNLSSEFPISSNFSYKSFSFNFKIPKYGWANFNNYMYADNPYYMSNILSNAEKNDIDSITTSDTMLNKFRNSIISFSGELSFLYGVLDNRVVEQVVGNGNYGDGGYTDVNGVYHSGAKINSNNVEVAGSAITTLSGAYNTKLVKIPFYGKYDNNLSKLIITSPNDTLSFTAKFNNSSSTSTWVELNGLFTSVDIISNGKSIKHNIIIPRLMLYVERKKVGTSYYNTFYISAQELSGTINDSTVSFPNERLTWNLNQIDSEEAKKYDLELMMRSFWSNEEEFNNLKSVFTKPFFNNITAYTNEYKKLQQDYEKAQQKLDEQKVFEIYPSPFASDLTNFIKKTNGTDKGLPSWNERVYKNGITSNSKKCFQYFNAGWVASYVTSGSLRARFYRDPNYQFACNNTYNSNTPYWDIDAKDTSVSSLYTVPKNANADAIKKVANNMIITIVHPWSEIPSSCILVDEPDYSKVEINTSCGLLLERYKEQNKIWRYLLGNMAPCEDQDENGFPYTYLPLCSFKFTTSPITENVSKFTWNNLSSYLIPCVKRNSEWKPLNSYYDQNYKLNDIIGAISDNEKITSENSNYIFDAEPLVIPFDMSTNLLYYKAENGTNPPSFGNINDTDEVIIINARKMYSEPNDIDKRPIGGKLALDLSKFEDTEIILTAFLPGNEERLTKYFNEVNVYVTSRLKYTTDQSKETDKHKCRYVEVGGQGHQSKLFELNQSVQFSTIDGLNIPLLPIQETNGNVESDIIDVPAKLTLTLSGLIFQQRCREGISFDDLSDITYSKQILSGALFDKLNTMSDWGSSGHVVKLGTAGRPAAVSIAGNCYFISSSYNDYIGQSAYFYGGSNYNCDFNEMKQASNSANKWKTYQLPNQFSKLLVYSDYNPTSGIIGTPYLNQLGKIVVKEIVNDNPIQYLASLAKVATDIAYVNPVLNVESYDDLPEYPETIVVTNRVIKTNLEGTNYSNVYLYSFVISGSIGDYNTYIDKVGIKHFTIPSKRYTTNNGVNTFYDNPNLEIGIYFDGLPGRKEVIIEDFSSLNTVSTINYNNKMYYVIGLNKSFVNLMNQNNEGIFYGSVIIQVSSINPIKNSNYVELHNFKLPSPIITSVGISFSNEQKANLDFDGYYSITDDIWQKQITFSNLNGSVFQTVHGIKKDNNKDQKIDYEDYRLYSSCQPGQGLSGNSTILTDNDGNTTGLLLTLQIPGIKLFDHAGQKFILENKQEVVIEDEDMLNTYNNDIGNKKYPNTTPISSHYMFEEDRVPNADIGSTVTSGTVSILYNDVVTKPMGGRVTVGHLRYKYNPIDDDKFQLEVITKARGEGYKRNIYFVNKEIDKWYNLSIYKTVKLNKKSNINSSIHFLLNDVDEENLNDISSKPHEIFRCFVSNDAHLQGKIMKCNLGYGTNFLNWKTTLFKENLSSSMQNWKSLYDIEFNKCMRSYWNFNYTNDANYLAFSKDETEDEYEIRKSIDLFKISDSLNGLDFKNTNGSIKLFANKEVEKALNENIKIDDLRKPYSKLKFYNLSITGNTNVDLPNNKWDPVNIISDSFDSKLSANYIQLRERLLVYEPRRVLVGDSMENFILKKKPLDKMVLNVKSCEIMANNIMFITTPNLSYNANNISGAYAESYYESLGAVNDYEEFFGNAQHRLPPVSYKNKLLDSDYATFVYNNSKYYEAIETVADSAETGIKTSDLIKYNYSYNPSRVSFTWGNSQVTRSETNVSKEYISRLYWNQAVFEEYVSEVGSIYNFTDSQHVTNVISIETGSINERQCTLMPVLSSPFKYERRSKEEGLVKVIDNIIATSALGYNSLGYPKNGILSYNTNGNVYINAEYRNYIYIEQQGASNSCSLGATVQKPVFIDSVTKNNKSLHEAFTFLPNPSITKETRSRYIDQSQLMIEGGNLNDDTASSKDLLLLFNGSTNNISDDIFSSFNSEYKLAYENEVDFGDILIYQYPLEDSVKKITNNQHNYKVKYIVNGLAIESPTLMNGNENVKEVNLNGINVFYNEEDYDTLISDCDGVFDTLVSSLTTAKCFGYDGKIFNGTTTINSSDPEFGDYNYYNSLSGYYYNLSKSVFNGDDKNNNYSYLSTTFKMDICPTIGVIWGDLNLILSDIETYNENMEYKIKDEETRHALMNQYLAVNLSSVKFKINYEDLQSAPTYIEIAVLKFNEDIKDFEWVYDGSLDFDIRDTYDSIYNSDSDVYYEREFINNERNLIKNVYGIKFIIKETVPQSKTINPCKIGNIQILVSNFLNNNGTAKSVDDVYVRRMDANYAKAYPIKCSEYVWRLPNSLSEWQAVKDALTEAEEFQTDENKNANDAMELYIDKLIKEESANKTVESYLSGVSNFQSVLGYYISNNANQNTEISEILSDNYLVDSSIQISWKYIDYVYIYYSCYSTNAKDLLDMYFGDKIYNAVKSKLINNINNLNVNSSFAGKYRITGGIAVQKENSLNVKTNTAAFSWKADVRTDQLDTYQDVYKTDYTKNIVTLQDQEIRTRVTTKHGRVLSSSSTVVNKGKAYTVSSTTAETHLAGTNLLSSKQTENYLGTTIQNVKYASVDNWTKTFSPRQIKFKIN